MKQCNEILFHFFACYFHQDRKLDDPSWQDVVNRVVRDEGDEAAGHVCEVLNKLLGETGSDEELAKIHALGMHHARLEILVHEVQSLLEHAPRHGRLHGCEF